MEKYRIKIAVIFTISALAISISLFVIVFIKQDISYDISDWAAFGNYIGGILSPILAILNLYLFYILTTATSKFTENNTIKQLCFNICNDYQKRINELIFEFLSKVELYNENKDERYNKAAKMRLVWLKYYANSFYNEVASLLPIQQNIKLSKEELEASVNKLMNSNFRDPYIMNDFIEKKSNFINDILNVIKIK